MKKQFILLVLIVALLTACRSTYKLSANDYTWMPYVGNEILVFSSNTFDTDTIFFLRKDTLVAYPEAQALNGITYEEVAIFCQHSDPSPSDGKHRYLKSYFVKIEKSKDKKARICPGLSAKDAWFYGLEGTKIDSLDKIKPISFQTKLKTYDDIYIIYPGDYAKDFYNRTNYVTKLYWSKSSGLVRYEKKDGIYWELAKKY